MDQLRNKEQKSFNGLFTKEDCLLLSEIIQSVIFPPLRHITEQLTNLNKSLLSGSVLLAVALDKNTRALEEIARNIDTK